MSSSPSNYKLAGSVLITTHFSPDPDAMGSALFTYGILKENFPHTKLAVVVEGTIPASASFLPYFDEITNQSLFETLKELKPDQLIMLDGNYYARFSRDEGDQVEQFIAENDISTMIIDHHPADKRSDVDIFINNQRSSASEEAYLLFVEEMGLKSNIRLNEAVLYGIIGDTGRFLYTNHYHRDTFRLVSEFIDQGLSIEKLEGIMNRISEVEISIITELLGNFQQEGDYNFSYMSDEFVDSLRAKGVSSDIYSSGYHSFMYQYLRNLSPNRWGFIVFSDIIEGKGFYKGSFRAVEGTVNTVCFSLQLDGAGHKLASGFKLEAKNIEEAVQQVQNVIRDNYDEAVKQKSPIQ